MKSVLIRSDADYETYEVLIDGEFVDGGNFWDFSFPDDLENILERVGVSVSVENYSYEEENPEEDSE